MPDPVEHMEETMPDLSLHKKVQCLRIYIGESDRWRGKSLESALLETLRSQGMAGATIFRGIAGFGAHSRIRTTAIEVLSLDIPIVVEVIDTPEKIAGIIDTIYPMVREGLIILEDVQIVKYTHRYLNPLPADKFVSDVMTRDVVAIAADKSVFQAWKQMLENRVKAMPVVDPSRRVIGILTDEDLLERAGIQQRLSVAIRMEKAEVEQELQALESSTLKVEDVMTHPAITVVDSNTLGIATTRMVKAGLKRLPVADKDGKLVGMLSRLDILREVAQTEPVLHAKEQPLPQVGRLVQDIMTTDIPMINQDEDLSAIIEKFALSDSHRLIVVDTQGKAIGLLSDSDVVARVQPSKRKNIVDALRRIGKPAPGKETALDLMSPGPLTAPPDLPVVEAVKKMLAESRKWLVVVDENEKPLGLVDRQMLLEAVIQ
jgi:CBS-domain-containing membrane protein/PII-like signaling protein